jgi:hypothetical protein
MSTTKTKKMSARKLANLTAFDLIGYEGDEMIRIKGKRLGRALYETVAVKDRYEDGAVVLQRIDTIEVDGEPKLKIINRWVDADTPVELVTKPVGQLIQLGGDMWISNLTKQYDASGAVIEILENKSGVLSAWVRWNVRMSDGEAPVDFIGTLDSSTAKMILDEDFSTEDGWDGKPKVISTSAFRTKFAR